MRRADVARKIISFECYEIDSGNSRGCGTAFWVNLSGQPTLVTAAHIPWPKLPPAPTVPQKNGEKLLVRWKLPSGLYGGGTANFYEHPNDPNIDFASIVFDEACEAPPGVAFELAATDVDVDTAIVSFGFPGPYASTSAKDTVGIVESLEPNGSRIFVGGTACGGYSGGPSFPHVSEDTVGDQVVGLMSGEPHPSVTHSHNLQDAYILVSARFFITKEDIGVSYHKWIGIALLSLSFLIACLYLISVFVGIFGYFWFATHTTLALSCFIIVLCFLLSSLAYLHERKRLSKFADIFWNLWALIGAILLTSDNLNMFASQSTSSLADFYHQLRSSPGCETAFFSALVLITSVRFSLATGGFLRDLFSRKAQRQ